MMADQLLSIKHVSSFFLALSLLKIWVRSKTMQTVESLVSVQLCVSLKLYFLFVCSSLNCVVCK